MNSSEAQTEIFEEAIKTLHSSGALAHVIIVGSWAEHVYEKSGALNLRKNIRTQDLDILVPNINRPREKIDLVSSFEKQGFELRQSHDGLMRFDKNGIIDIEFLTRDMGRGQVEPYKVNSLGVTAQGLRNMEILTENTTVLHAEGYNITVPQPAAYVLHKLVINQDRKPDHKKAKDIEAIKDILTVMNQDPAALQQINTIYQTLTPKQQRRINDTCEKNAITLPGIHENSIKAPTSTTNTNRLQAIETAKPRPEIMTRCKIKNPDSDNKPTAWREELTIYSKAKPDIAMLNLEMQADSKVEAVESGYKLTIIVNDRKHLDELIEKADMVFADTADQKQLTTEVYRARAIDSNKNVKTWVRNLERQSQTSFWLPTSKDKFYPDFVAELTDGRILVIEYKGEHLATNKDTQEKELVGKLWADRSDRKCVFLMATRQDEAGRGVYEQINSCLCF